MRIRERFISILLLLIMLILIIAVGTLGYAIFKEIMGEGSIKLNITEAGYPTIEYTTSPQNPTDSTTNDTNFSGVDDGQQTTTLAQNRYRHLYNQLDSSAKIIYDKLYSNKDNLKTGTYAVEFGNTFKEELSQTDGDKELQRQYQSAIEVLIYENPDIFYLDATNMYLNIEKVTRITGVSYNVYINNGTKTSYLAEGFYSKEDVNRAEQLIEQVRDQIVSATNGKSDYEKIRTVHDYLVNNIEYESTLLQSNIYNIYGALVSNKCVCEGYAKAFQYLMNEIGIDNVIVIGTGINSKNETENHAWNYVKLNDNWYAIDSTWDDPILIGGGNLTNQLKYKYFLKGSNTMNKNHTTSGKFTEDGQIFTYPTLSTQDYK